jgi:hypothetical protein
VIVDGVLGIGDGVYRLPAQPYLRNRLRQRPLTPFRLPYQPLVGFARRALLVLDDVRESIRVLGEPQQQFTQLVVVVVLITTMTVTVTTTMTMTVTVTMTMTVNS